MASRNLESRFERMSVQDENEHGYSKSKVSATWGLFVFVTVGVQY